MYLALQTRIQHTVRDFLGTQYGVADANVVLNVPPRPEMGDLALPTAMELARRLRRPPRQIAEEIAAALRVLPDITRVETAGAGYVNIFLKRSSYLVQASDDLNSWADAITVQQGTAEGGKIIVEHTNINPNKAAHIGHLRNSALGDTFVRLLRARGHHVEVQNYIDNTGVQVADVVAAFVHLEKKTAREVIQLIGDEAGRFDYYCWDLYARVSRSYQERPENISWRNNTLQAIEQGAEPEAGIAEMVSNAIVRKHLATMLRLNVEYDVLPRESEILHLRFWNQAFKLLKEKGAIYLESEGKNKGCWVMRNPEPQRVTDSSTMSSSGSSGSGADSAPSTAAEDSEAAGDETKVIVRSNGTVTYVGKDIAYQLWKFGLLGRDFYYQPFETYPDGRIVWVSSAEPPSPDADEPPEFGKGRQVYNVIDVRQSYLQEIVQQGLRALGYEAEAERSIHFSYAMVALSPHCCEQMGIELSDEEKKRPFVEVSGRKGLGVKADDLIDRLLAEAQHEVDQRHPAETLAYRERIARQIAIGALRYFLLKYTCNSIIAFDFEEALSFEGETGPYVQYAAVRARNIFRKLEEEGGSFDGSAPPPEALERFFSGEDGDAFWQLLYLASRWEAMAELAIATTEPAAVAKFAFQLAQAFNNFYHRYRILTEQDPARRHFLLWLVHVVERHLTTTLDLLGIEVPEAM